MPPPYPCVKLAPVPLTLKAANSFIKQHHRHHGEFPAGLDYFRLGAQSEDVLVGVAIVARPPNRNSDDGTTCEIVRLATDGTPNACTFLYSACARIAKHMGFVRIITYILSSETGTSLKASGWRLEREGIKSYWFSHQSPGRTIRAASHFAETKSRWARQLQLNIE